MLRTVLLASILAIPSALPCWAGFSAPMGCYNQSSSGNSVSCTLASAPAAGSAVAVFAVSHGQTALLVKDGNSNVYTLTPHSPSSTHDATAGSAWLAYFIAGSSANPTVTASWGSGACTACSITVMSFPVVGGSATFDTDAIGAGTGPISLPAVTPAGSSELLIGACADSGGCGAVTGSWVASPTGLGSFLEAAEYSLAGSAATTVGFAGSVGSAAWDTIGMAFKLSTGGTFKGAAVTGSAVFSPCDLNQDGVINSADVTVAVNDVITPPATCTAVITGAGSCNAAVVQRVVAATLPGGTCHPTTLSWTASTSANIVGYNVYRTTTSGSNYTKLNSSPLTGTGYADATTQPGTTYYYVATSVNSGGSESSFSSPPAQVTVPNP
jgi:hypothetical protein